MPILARPLPQVKAPRLFHVKQWTGSEFCATARTAQPQLADPTKGWRMHAKRRQVGKEKRGLTRRLRMVRPRGPRDRSDDWRVPAGLVIGQRARRCIAPCAHGYANRAGRVMHPVGERRAAGFPVGELQATDAAPKVIHQTLPGFVFGVIRSAVVIGERWPGLRLDLADLRRSRRKLYSRRSLLKGPTGAFAFPGAIGRATRYQKGTYPSTPRRTTATPPDCCSTLDAPDNETVDSSLQRRSRPSVRFATLARGERPTLPSRLLSPQTVRHGSRPRRKDPTRPPKDSSANSVARGVPIGLSVHHLRDSSTNPPRTRQPGKTDGGMNEPLAEVG